MLEIEKNLFIAKEEEVMVLDNPQDYAIVSLAHTFHLRLHNWHRGENHQTDPCYIIHEEDELLSVNWVDGAKHLYNWKNGGVSVTRQILNFMLKYYLRERPLIVFCNQATSRAPTIMLLFLARRLKKINDFSYRRAYQDFMRLYPAYSPKGIADFVEEHWDEF